MGLRRFQTLGPLLTLGLGIMACGGGGLYTDTAPTTEQNLGAVAITRNAFVLGSDYPAEIVIPDIEGMRDIAFVVSTENPSGIVAIDLLRSPLALSTTFRGLTIPPGHGLPRGPLALLGPQRAFCLTSSHLIDFDPTSGAIHAAIALLGPVTLSLPRPLSRPYDVDGNGTEETTVATFTPRFPGGLAVIGDRLFVSLSNYLQATPPAAAAPGLVRAFTIHPAAPYLAAVNEPPIVTSFYNPTALTPLPDGALLVVNSGVNNIAEGKTIPATDAGVDFLDPATGSLTGSVNLGPVALSFQPPAITTDGTLAFLPSATYGEIYAVNLADRTALFDHAHPITITGNTVGSDFLTDGALAASRAFLFVSSFATSAIYPVDLSEIVPKPLPAAFPDPIVVGFPAGVTAENPSGVNTGIGAIAIRPGIAGTDFTGPDLFALTGTPGSVVAIDTTGVGTSRPAAGPPPPATDAEGPIADEAPPSQPPAPPAQSGGAPTSPAGGSPLVLLDDPPPPATAFADAVTAFHQGVGGGFGLVGGKPTKVIGAPHGTGTNAGNMDHVVSLGCGGSITLAMTDFWIADGPGIDFLVFENAFYAGGNPKAPYAEPAAVAVSADGATFAEFPCNATSYPYAGCAGVHPVLTNPQNGLDPTDPALAGGDGFDLAAVKMATARFVRIRDVSCSGVNDPKSGFDLDAVAIVHGTIPH